MMKSYITLLIFYSRLNLTKICRIFPLSPDIAELCKIPRKQKFRGSAQNSMCLGKLWSLAIILLS